MRRLADKIAEGDVYCTKEEEITADVAERQRWRREFTDYVQKQAEATEQQVAAAASHLCGAADGAQSE